MYFVKWWKIHHSTSSSPRCLATVDCTANSSGLWHSPHCFSFSSWRLRMKSVTRQWESYSDIPVRCLFQMNHIVTNNHRMAIPVDEKFRNSCLPFDLIEAITLHFSFWHTVILSTCDVLRNVLFIYLRFISDDERILSTCVGNLHAALGGASHPHRLVQDIHKV